MKEKECILAQQDDEYSNLYSCSNCHNDFYWGEEPEDIKNSNIAYCPFCGCKITDVSFIEYEAEESE